ncbi:MAG: elongation factor P-like protein YeiP [Pontibacterium sp.]
MPKASELKKGHIVEIDGNLYIAIHIDVRNPTSRGANTLYKVRFNQVPNGGKREESYSGDILLKDVALERRQVSFLYKEDDLYTFMDAEDYSQYMINANAIEAQVAFLSDGMENITALLVDGEIIAIELPTSLVFEVVECIPGMQAASATGRTKPAILSNGMEVQVPEYMKQGENVKISTETGKFMSRV